MRPIDADALVNDIEEDGKHGLFYSNFERKIHDSKIEFAVAAVTHAPTIDAVQVIRCADCAYSGKSPFGHPAIGWCRIDCKHRKPDFFCANADRRVKHEI